MIVTLLIVHTLLAVVLLGAITHRAARLGDAPMLARLTRGHVIV